MRSQNKIYLSHKEKKITKPQLNILIILFILFTISQSTSLVQVFGMTDLLTNLAKIDTTLTLDNQTINIYYSNPDIFQMLKTFKSRTQFCDYKCPDFYNVPCFILFGCNIQIRNVILIFVMPLIGLIMLGMCCGKGIWTFRCWGKYIAMFTGILFIIWLVEKCVKGNKFKKRKEKVRKQFQKDKKDKVNIKINDEIGPSTTKRIKDGKNNQQESQSE